jgi:DNA-binding NarL/FixJ family response regulator
MADAVIRVVVVDDHDLFRAGLSEMLARVEGLDVVGTAASGADALAVIKRERPDVCLLDLMMPGEPVGPDLIRESVSISPETTVIMVTMSSDPRDARACLAAGARGFVVKETPLDDLVKVIQLAPLSIVVSRAVSSIFDSFQATQTSVAAMATLSHRETVVLELVAQGLSNREIADRLSVSERTVKNLVTAIMAKLGTPNRTAAAVLAHDAGLLLQ